MLFPIREGLDRLTWNMAKAMKDNGFDVEIRCIAKKKKIKYADGIRIIEDNLLRLSRFKTDILHILIHPNPEIVLPLFFATTKKIFITIADGELGNFWQKWWSPFIIWLVRKKIDSVLVQTRYQQSKLAKLSIPSKIIFPYLDAIRRKCRRDPVPSLLYMGLPAKQKGFTDVVDAFHIAKKEIRNLRLIIADSHIRKNTADCYKQLLRDKSIIIKDIINREIELSKAWIYMYPMRSPRNTMAVPLSLVESAKIGTAFISTRVGGIPEIIPDCFLVSPSEPNALARKIIELIKEYPKKIVLKNKPNNKQIIAKLLAEYSRPR